MDEEKNQSAYDDLQETVDEYGEHSADDMLTDSASVEQAMASVADEAAASHAHRIRSAREQSGFTIEELANKTGIDAKLLTEVETGESLLPLGQLIKLSKALSLRMADVISEGKESFTIVRADERKSIARFGEARESSHGYEYESLAPGKKDRMMEPFLVTLKPAVSDEPSTHDGQEFIYVLEGEMEVMVENAREVLKPGDSVYYDSSSTHLVRAHGDKPAKILAVLIS